MKFSNGWLQKFRNRSKFKRYIVQGESVDTDAAVVERDLPALREKLSTYD